MKWDEEENEDLQKLTPLYLRNTQTKMMGNSINIPTF